MACGYRTMLSCYGPTTSKYFTRSLLHRELKRTHLVAGAMCVDIPYQVSATGRAGQVYTTM